MQRDQTLPGHELALLYQDHHGWLRNWLTQRTGCRDRAADLVQDTFLRLLKGQRFDSLREPRAYLSSIARTLMIDQYRRRLIEEAYLESLGHLPEQEVPSEEQRLLILDTLERLDQLLSRLPMRVRQAFLFAQIDGLTCQQIAEKLNVSRATIERDLAKALVACYRLRYADD